MFSLLFVFLTHTGVKKRFPLHMMFVSFTFNMTYSLSVAAAAYPAGAQDFPQYLAVLVLLNH